MIHPHIDTFLGFFACLDFIDLYDHDV
jgi:hypothetical protein